MNKTLTALFPRILAGDALTRREAVSLLPLISTDLPDLMAMARVAVGEAEPFACTIINAKSGRCSEDCAFCAQSHRNPSGPSAQPLLSEDDLASRAEILAATGVRFVGLVTAGAGPTDRELDRLCRAAGRIIRETGVDVCASFGILGPEEARRLRDAGFASCHHNLETSRSRFPEVCSTHGYESRVETVVNAKAAGLRTCSGGIFGIGESWEDRFELFAELVRLGVDSIPVNFLIPIPGTPLSGAPPPEPAEALAIIALLRLMHPHRDVIVCAGRSGSLGRYDELTFLSGANGLMIGDFLTVEGSPSNLDLEYLKTMGWTPARNRPTSHPDTKEATCLNTSSCRSSSPCAACSPSSVR